MGQDADGFGLVVLEGQALKIFLCGLIAAREEYGSFREVPFQERVAILLPE